MSSTKHLLVAGAWPNFMKIAPIHRAFSSRRNGHWAPDPLLVHTGQHYSRNRSEDVFRDLGMFELEINLEVGSWESTSGKSLTRQPPNPSASCLSTTVLVSAANAFVFAGRWTPNVDHPAPVRAVVDDPARPIGFVKADEVTKGSWRGVYGAEGVAIANEKAMLPAYAQVKWPRDAGFWIKSAPGETRALQKTNDPSDRVASSWYSFSGFDIDIAFTDTRTHQVALYMVDWDSNMRKQIVRVTDAATSKVLDERAVSAFTGCQYLAWNLRGHVTIKITRVAGANAVVSGLFLN